MPTANNTSFRRWFPWPPSSTSSYNKTTRFVLAKCQQHQQKKHFGKSKLHCFHTWRVKWTSRVGLENRKMSAHHLCLIVCYTGALERCVTTLKNGCVADYISFDVCLLNRGREAKLNRSTIEDILGISCVLWYRPLAIWAERASERILNNCEIMIILKNDHK